MAAAKRPATTKRRKSSSVDLHAMGARVRSVFGPFGASVLLEMSTEAAQQLFPDGLTVSAPTRTMAAVERELEALRTRAPEQADSALAATAAALAFEIDHPFNSATSKSMCARALMEALEGLRELAPAEEETDGVDDLTAQRKKRIADRARRAATSHPSSS